MSKDKGKSKTSDKAEGKDKKKSELEELKQKAGENLAGWQKALADYQNLQKEMDSRLASMSDFTTSAFVLELLPVFDNYRTAITHIPENQQKESWAVGLEHILKMWESFLADHNIKKIDTIDKVFDPSMHESVGEVNDKDKKDQVIVEEKQSGYILKESVIRPAKVIINNIK